MAKPAPAAAGNPASNPEQLRQRLNFTTDSKTDKTPQGMTREILPDRRPNETRVFQRDDGIRITMTTGFKADGSPGELFLNANRANSMLDVLLSDAAIVISIALQYGVPLRQLAHAVKRDANGIAASPIGLALDRISTPEVLSQ
jgi:hypothetical protein